MEITKQKLMEPEGVGLAVESESECLVFRTSLKTWKDVEIISAVLDNLAGISDWHVDLYNW